MCEYFSKKTSVYELINNFLKFYLLQRNLDKTVSFVSDDIYCVGTGKSEVCVGKDKFTQKLNEWIKTFPNIVDYQISDYNEKCKGDNNFYCLCNVGIHLKMDNGEVAIYNVRLTVAICKENTKLLIQSLHLSEGSMFQEEKELFPIKFISKQSDKMNKATQQELWNIFYQMIPSGVIGGYISEGYPLYVINNQMLNMMGYSYDEFVESTGGLLVNTVHEDDRKRVWDIVETALSEGNQYEVEYKLNTKDGYMWVYDIGRKTITQDGKEAIISIVTDISKQVRIKEKLFDESIKDPLTQIYNRKGAEKRISDELNKVGKSYIFIMLDLDNFKQLNDIYGHAAGDDALRFIARILNKSFRKTDTVCRYGGDEFAVFVSNCSCIKAIIRKVNNISIQYKNMIKKRYPKSLSTVSFGGFQSQDSKTLNDIYKIADSILYEVKNKEKGTCIIKSI